MNVSDFLRYGEIYGVVSSKDAPPRGSGKTVTALSLVLQQANLLNYGLVFNFDINAQALYYYCYYMGYHNVIRHFKLGNVVVKPVTNVSGKTDLSNFIQGIKKIFVLDEAGIFCSARNWNSLPDNWQANLAMMRQYHIRLWWISQHYDHVDKLLRSQSNYIIECSSVLTKSKSLGGASKMITKIYYFYTNKSYNYLFAKSDKISGLNFQLHRMRFAKFRHISPLSTGDKMLFTVYKSFNKSIGDNPVLFNFPAKLFAKEFYKYSHKTHIPNYCYLTIFNSPLLYSYFFSVLESFKKPALYLNCFIHLLGLFIKKSPFEIDVEKYKNKFIEDSCNAFDLSKLSDIPDKNSDETIKTASNNTYDVSYLF